MGRFYIDLLDVARLQGELGEGTIDAPALLADTGSMAWHMREPEDLGSELTLNDFVSCAIRNCALLSTPFIQRQLAVTYAAMQQPLRRRYWHTFLRRSQASRPSKPDASLPSYPQSLIEARATSSACLRLAVKVLLET